MRAKGRRPIAHLLMVTALVAGCSKPVSRIMRVGQASAPPPNVSSYGVQGTAESRLRLGTHKFVSSTLEEIFAADYATAAGGSAEATARAAALAALADLVTDESLHFGGPCDKYQAGCQASRSQLPVVPTAATARMALTVRVCDRLVANDALVRHAVARALGVASVASPSLPTDAQIAGAYQLFYPDQEIPAPGLAGLRAVVTQTQTQGYAAIEAWRFLLLTLCHSPDWQVT